MGQEDAAKAEVVSEDAMTEAERAARPPTIYEAMRRIIGDLPAIGKNQRNKDQGFNFRGVDDVINALHPLLAKHGVFFVPDVIERKEDVRATRGGASMYVVNLHVRYTFYGPSGDSFAASGWGEGTDMGDKSTNKAMTGALKYVLFQVFAVATEDTAVDDSDAITPEPTLPLWQIVKDRLLRMVQGDVDRASGVVHEFFGNTYPGSIHQVPTKDLQRFMAHLDAIEASGSVPPVAEGPPEAAAVAPPAEPPEQRPWANAEQVKAIRSLVARIEGVTEADVCQTAKVGTLEGLGADQAAKLIKTMTDLARTQKGASR